MRESDIRSEVDEIVLSPLAIFLTQSQPHNDCRLRWAILIGLVSFILYGIVTDYWPRFVQRWREKQARDWPTTPAVIVISVADTRRDTTGESVIISHLVLLTYSYRNPELQTGDYTRHFDNEYDAQDWADLCKDRKITVRVDPQNSTRSVLRTEELDAALLKEPA